jgi:hypothetical protein
MLSYLYGHDALVAQFVAQLVPHCHRGFPPEARGIGVLNESGVLIGGLVYHNYDDDSGLIELTGADRERAAAAPARGLRLHLHQGAAHVWSRQGRRPVSADGRRLGE